MKINAIYKPCILFCCFIYFCSVAVAQNPVPFQNGDEWGYKLLGSNEILLGKLDRAEPFRNKLGISIKNRKWGAVNPEMKVLIPFEFEKLELLSNSLIRAQKNGLYELFTFSGEKIGATYKDVSLLKDCIDTLVIADQQGKYGLMTHTGRVIIPLKYDGPPRHLTGTDLGFVKKIDDTYYEGVVTLEGTEIVPFKFLFITIYRSFYYKCESVDGEHVIYSRQGNIAYQQGNKQDTLFSLTPEYTIVSKNGIQELLIHAEQKTYESKHWNARTGYVDGLNLSGSTVIYVPKRSTIVKKGIWQIHQFKDSVFLVSKAESPKLGLINMQGKELLEATFTGIQSWSDQWAVVQSGINSRYYGLFNLQSRRLALAEEYDKIELLTCNFVGVTKSGKTVYLDQELREVSFSERSKLKNNYYLLADNVLDKLNWNYSSMSGGRTMYEYIQTSEACSERNQLISKVQGVELLTDKYGKNPLPNRLIVRLQDPEYRAVITNFDGKELTPMEYIAFKPHEQGMIPFAIHKKLDVGRTNLWGIIDSNGQVILPALYEDIQEIIPEQGVAIVVIHGLYSLVNLKTQELVLKDFNGIRYTSDGYFFLTKFNKQGIADNLGHILIDVKYTHLSFVMEIGNLYTAERDGKNYYVDLKNNESPR